MNNNMEKEVVKATRYEIEQTLERFIGNLKLEGVSTKGKVSLVEFKIELGKIVKEIAEFKKVTQESVVKPENYDELKVASEKEDATEEMKKEFKEVEEEYNKALAEIIIPYYNEVIELPFNYIDKKDFLALVEHNDVNVVYGYEMIYNNLVKEEK